MSDFSEKKSFINNMIFAILKTFREGVPTLYFIYQR
jgi:hypothetical protein